MATWSNSAHPGSVSSGTSAPKASRQASAVSRWRRIPPLNGKVALRYQPHAATWARLEWHTAAKQDRLAKGDEDDNRIPEGGTPGWNVVNAAAGYQIRKISLSAELQNIFNEAYRTHGSGVFGVGRSLWLMARFDW